MIYELLIHNSFKILSPFKALILSSKNSILKMQPGFLLNYYQKKNKNSLKNLMKKLPVDLSNMIVDYKYKFDHNEKMLKLNKEFLDSRYWCTCCDTDKFETITPISYICECCKTPTCRDCEDCLHYDDENHICNNCFLCFSIISSVERLVGRKITHNEMDEITSISDNLRDNEEIEELLRVFEVLEEYYIDIPESEEEEPTFFTFDQMKIELNSIVNSIMHDFDEMEEDDEIEIEA